MVDIEAQNQDYEDEEGSDPSEEGPGASDAPTGTESPEGPESQGDNSSRKKIGLPEAVIVLLATALADLAEFIPLFGTVFGFFVTGGVLIWSYFAGMYTARRRATKVILMLGGPALELITVGLLPEAFTLLAAILIHNYGDTKRVGNVLQKTASRIVSK